MFCFEEDYINYYLFEFILLGSMLLNIDYVRWKLLFDNTV